MQLYMARFHFDAQIYKRGSQVPGSQNLNIHNGQIIKAENA